MHLNVEIKAQCADPSHIREILEREGAKSVGLDHQVDTYFDIENGRLKLRQGNIENSLIHYKRPNLAGPKKSEVTLHPTQPDANSLKEVLTRALGIFITVDKKREIYFIENVKFHLDSVKGLGYFVEIEAIDQDGTLGVDYLHEQCARFMDLFSITPDQLIDKSYSDLLSV
ncbi:MAG: class IV adenylate cyclase [Saprospiraceae bacterium]|nr:class IV adenylate cyclase [Saprospiraceae bacterium]